MNQTILEGLFGKGGTLRVRSLMTLSLTGGAIFLVVTGILPVVTFVAVWASVVGMYTGVRAVEDRINLLKPESLSQPKPHLIGLQRREDNKE